MQASRFERLLFDPFPLFQNGFVAPEVDIGFRMSVSSPLLDGYDEPEILLMPIPQICPTGADVRHTLVSVIKYLCGVSQTFDSFCS